MSQASKLALIKEMLESAEGNLRSAKQMISELVGPSGKNLYARKAESIEDFDDEDSGEDKVVEGVFDGEKMQDKNEKTFPVPANYASKSKLVPGDVLKLTIKADGSFVYKQIGPVERKKVVGVLTYEDGQYRVIAASRAFKVLLASVTYHKAEIGDQVTLIIPEIDDSDWGAIEAVIPKDITSLNTDGEF